MSGQVYAMHLARTQNGVLSTKVSERTSSPSRCRTGTPRGGPRSPRRRARSPRDPCACRRPSRRRARARRPSPRLRRQERAWHPCACAWPCAWAASGRSSAEGQTPCVERGGGARPPRADGRRSGPSLQIAVDGGRSVDVDEASVDEALRHARWLPPLFPAIF